MSSKEKIIEDIETLNFRDLNELLHYLGQPTVAQYALEKAQEMDPDPETVLGRADEILKFLIKSGDEIHYAYSDEEILAEARRRGISESI